MKVFGTKRIGVRRGDRFNDFLRDPEKGEDISTEGSRPGNLRRTEGSADRVIPVGIS